MKSNETLFTNFPVYRLTFRKEDLKPKHIMSMRLSKVVNLSKLRRFDQDSRITSLLLPVKEDKEKISIIFTKKKFPVSLYLDFVIIATNKGYIYPIDEIKDFGEFLKQINGDLRFIYCGGVINHQKINTKIKMKTEDCLFKANTSIRKWINRKFGIKIPKNTTFDLEINYHTHPDKPFVLFNKKDDRDTIRHVQNIKDGKINNLILSKNSGTWGNNHRRYLEHLSYGQIE